MSHSPLVTVTRGRQIESLHRGAVAVAEPSGQLRAWLGDPRWMTFLRSTAKPFQAIPFLRTGAAASFEATAQEIALVCASHDGTPLHVEGIKGLQAKVGVEEADLQCGVHAPSNAEAANELIRSGRQATENHNTCSGKHTGMLATARFQGEPLESYLELDHPVQQRILMTLSEVSGVPPKAIPLAVDGCSAPTHALPLAAMAKAYALLADPSDLPAAQAEAIAEIYQAMTAQPEFVGGTDRFVTELMMATDGRLLAKEGVEGVVALAVKPAGKWGPLGIAVKVADGDPRMRAAPLAAIHVLVDLGLLDPAQAEELIARRAELRTHRGDPVGELEWTGELEFGGE